MASQHGGAAWPQAQPSDTLSLAWMSQMRVCQQDVKHGQVYFDKAGAALSMQAGWGA